MIYFSKKLAYKLKFKYHLNSNTAFLILLFALLIVTKLIFLDADTVAIENLHNEDEGNYVYNVRNYLVESSLFKDDTNFTLVSPFYSLLVLIFTKSLGISIFAFRFTSAFFGIMSITLGTLFLRKYTGKYAYIFGLFLASDFLFNIHSRIAMPEITVSFFFLASFIIYTYAQKFNKLWIFYLSGLFSGLGFLVKSSAVVIFATIVTSIVFQEIWRIYTLKKIKTAYLKNSSLHIIFAIFGFIIPIILWYIFILKPNLKYFNLVYIGLIQLHKPQIRAQLMDPIFLFNELKEFLIGGEGNVWLYLSPYLAVVLVGSFYAIKNKIKFNRVFWFSVLWFLIGNIYFYILWYKPARWYVPNIIPLLIITSFLLCHLPNKLKIVFVVFIISVNSYLNFKYIYSKPTYYLKNASLKIEKIVGNNTCAGDSLLLMENKRSKAFNPYFIQPVYTKITFNTFLENTKYPEFIVVNNNQYNNTILNTAKYKLLISNLKASNLKNPKIIEVYQLLN